MGNKYHILIIDDDADLSAIIAEMLMDYGYQVTHAPNGERAFQLLAAQPYQLILLDINLPDTDGFSICRELRRICSVPIIFASARTSETDRIEGYDMGGDDYLPKPYSLRELLAKTNALIRRTYGYSQAEETIRFGQVTVEPAARRVVKNGQLLSLSLKEFDLLACLCLHANTAVSRETLLSEVWGPLSDVEPATLAVHIRWLREKLEDDPANPRHIKTIHRFGYKLEVDPHEK